VTLTKRLLGGSLVIVVVLVVAIVMIAGSRLAERLTNETRHELEREARLVAIEWTPRIDADSLADAAGVALGRRVTIIDADGTVIGDSEFDRSGMRQLQNHSTRPEVIEAKRAGVGCSLRHSPSAGDNEIYCAVTNGLGVVRVSVVTTKFREIVSGAQRDVLVAGLIALIGALVVGWFFSRSISRPIVELRDVAQAIARGDLDRRPTLSGPGEIGDLAHALHRMTEQLAARLTALESEDALLNAVIESLDEGVIAVSSRAEVVRLNRRAQSLFRLPTTVPFTTDLIPPERPIRLAIMHAMAGASTGPTEVEVDGRTMSITARPLPDGGAVLAVLDLTARRRLETMRRDFVANVSHELKTPLTVIRGFAETLRDSDLSDDEHRRFLETIDSNTRRMQRIVDDLLDLSRYESGNWQPNLEPNEVTSVASAVFAGVQTAANAKGITLRLDAPEGAQVDADPIALRQVLANLVENAVRHTTDGTIVVRTSESRAGGLTIAVCDTGSGIAPEHLPRIFERFYRVDSDRGRDKGGTGLGLAIVRHLVEAHGGSVHAESVLGHGTTITVHFPPAHRHALQHDV
jgi:two-component system, OmpR family, phosphate regulon sensor histidine kinase PhoR